MKQTTGLLRSHSCLVVLQYLGECSKRIVSTRLWGLGKRYAVKPTAALKVCHNIFRHSVRDTSLKYHVTCCWKEGDTPIESLESR
eukprot:3088810-Amphidinium_carterae.1